MPLRIVVHDYSGHPFQVQLSRELARRGHRVLHLHSPSYRSGKGALDRLPDDPDTLAIEPVDLGRTFDKYSPARRLLQERAYGRQLVERLQREPADVVLSGNTPLFAQSLLLAECRRRGVPFVFWQQDVYSLPMQREAERRLPPVVGPLVGRRFVGLERRLLRESDAVVTIAGDFRETLLAWGLPAEKVRVIENWAPLDELPQRPRDNDWARRHDLAGKRVLLYSGTLGLKHDPGLLLRLARELDHEATIVVVSEGLGADWLRREADAQATDNLVLLPFQPYDELPDVLASGDVLLVLLERAAGRFAVPSKVLSYLCAGRPLLAAVPAENLAAAVVRASGAGVVVDPDDEDGVVAAARRLVDGDDRVALGRAARTYAERTFDIAAVGGRFEEVLMTAAGTTQVPSAP